MRFEGVEPSSTCLGNKYIIHYAKNAKYKKEILWDQPSLIGSGFRGLSNSWNRAAISSGSCVSRST